MAASRPKIVLRKRIAAPATQMPVVQEKMGFSDDVPSTPTPTPAEGWHIKETCGYRKGSIPRAWPPAVYCYDYDDTLAAHGTTMPWMDVKPRLEGHLAEGSMVVVFTNRKGQLHKNVQANLDGFRHEMGKAGDDIWYFYATADDKYRKPQAGMFNLFCELSGANAALVTYYCGDSAGRPHDYSDFDKLFAETIGVPFVVPEALEPLAGTESGTDGYKRIQPQPSEDEIHKTIRAALAAGQPLTIVMVGPPACGKSTLSALLDREYGAAIINADSQGKRQAGIFAARVQEGHPLIIIDNTNRTREHRQSWARPGRTLLIVVFDVPKVETMVNIAARERITGVHIPKIAVHTYYKHYEEELCAPP